MSDKNSNAVSLWSVIYKIEEGEYDAVPNEWLIDKTQCHYPTKNRATATKWARTSVVPDDSSKWEIIQITLEKLNIDSFEKAFDDACRKEKGKRSKSDSEKDTGRRKSRAPKRYSPDSTLSSASSSGTSSDKSSDESLESGDSPPRKKRRGNKRKSKKSPSKRRPKAHQVLSSSPLSKVPSYMRRAVPKRTINDAAHSPKFFSPPKGTGDMHNLEMTLEKSPIKKRSPHKDHARRNLFSNSESVEEAAQNQVPSAKKINERNIFSVKLCPLGVNKTHHCVTSKEPVTLLDLAIALCHLSRNLEMIKYHAKKNYEALHDRMEDLLRQEDTDKESDSDDDDLEELPDCLKNQLPLKSFESLTKFDSDLTEVQIQQFAQYFREEANTTKLSTMARDCVKIFMDQSLFHIFSWSGSNKKGNTKKSFMNLNLTKALMEAVKKVFRRSIKDYRIKVKNTLRSFLTQNRIKA